MLTSFRKSNKTIKKSLFLCFTFRHNVSLWVFKSKRQLYVVQDAFAYRPHIALDQHHLIKSEMFFISVCSDDCAKPSTVAYVLPFYFMKTGHELDCCVFILRECIRIFVTNLHIMKRV